MNLPIGMYLCTRSMFLACPSLKSVVSEVSNLPTCWLWKYIAAFCNRSRAFRLYKVS